MTSAPLLSATLVFPLLESSILICGSGKSSLNGNLFPLRCFCLGSPSLVLLHLLKASPPVLLVPMEVCALEALDV